VAGHFRQSAARALAAIPATDGPGIYAVSFFVWDQEDDPRRPALTIGYNTEAQVQHALAAPPAHSPGPPGDEAQARWNYAYWLRNELAVIGDDTSDPEGATLIEAQIKACGWWYSEPDGSTDQDWAQADAAAEQHHLRPAHPRTHPRPRIPRLGGRPDR
jgi:hypothetical protein